MFNYFYLLLNIFWVLINLAPDIEGRKQGLTALTQTPLLRKRTF